MGHVADSIRRGLEEALAYAEGTADASRYGVHMPKNIEEPRAVPAHPTILLDKVASV